MIIKQHPNISLLYSYLDTHTFTIKKNNAGWMKLDSKELSIFASPCSCSLKYNFILCCSMLWENLALFQSGYFMWAPVMKCPTLICHSNINFCGNILKNLSLCSMQAQTLFHNQVIVSKLEMLISLRALVCVKKYKVCSYIL